VGKVGDGLPLVREQLTDADRQPVEAGARPPDLRRARHGRAGRQLPAGQAVGSLREGGQRANQGAGELVRHHDAEQEQQQADPAEQQPGPGHAVSQDRVRHEGADHRGPAGQALHSHQHLLAARRLGGEAAAVAGQPDRWR
jgi:hypothetical protein